jgi:hypothetical protein
MYLPKSTNTIQDTHPTPTHTGSPRHSTDPAHPWEAYTGCDTAGDNRGSQGGHGD